VWLARRTPDGGELSRVFEELKRLVATAQEMKGV
jgi:hypothetical protein